MTQHIENAPKDMAPTHSELIEQIRTIAQSYSQSDLLSKFINLYYFNLSIQDRKRCSAIDLAGMALNHLSLLNKYDRQSPKVEVFNPSAETHHFHSSHSIIQMVAYDRPFLVDTLLLALEAQNIIVHRLYHTIIRVVYDDDGNITDIHKIVDGDIVDSDECRYISLIHCEIDRQLSQDLDAIQKPLLDKVTTLDTIVNDWDAMKERLSNVKQELKGKQIEGSPYSIDEIIAFLDWILDDYFIFLGFREYRLDESAGSKELFAIGESGLGLLRSDEQESRSEGFHRLPNELKHLLTVPQVLLLSKSSHVSPVQRPVYMDFLGIQKFDNDNKLIGEYRFIGMLTSRAYQLEVRRIPLLREKTKQILARAELPRNGHAHNKLLHIINTLPRDDLFQGRIDELYPIVSGIANLQDRKRLRLFTRIDHYQRFVSCLIFIPRDKFNTELRMKVQSALTEAYAGNSSGFTTEFDESHHARVHVHVRTTPGNITDVDNQALEDKLNQLMLSWRDSFESAMLEDCGESTANYLIKQYLPRIPASYQESFDVRTAILDIKRLDELKEVESLKWHLYQSVGSEKNQLNLKVYGKGVPAILSNVLPILEKFGVQVLAAQTYEFNQPSGASFQQIHTVTSSSDNSIVEADNFTFNSDSSMTSNVNTNVNLDAIHDSNLSGNNKMPGSKESKNKLLWMQEYELVLRHVDTVNMEVVHKQFENSLEEIWQGRVESDHFNELVLTTRLDTYEVVVLRALSRYMLQAKAHFSSNYIQKTLVKNCNIAVQLIDFFDAKMNPNHEEKNRDAKVDEIRSSLKAALKKVASLDEELILRWYYDLISAMLRTNFYQRDTDGKRKDRLSFKFAADRIPNLPKPKPMFEIFVYSPRVEAVHLRGGKVARGGLRWSDRMEDFRTEVLGLVKAQMVKNAVIVPVGSKGGFIVKKVTRDMGSEAFQKEGVSCYQTFLRGMLDITDNIVEGEIVAPKNTVRHDGDDPYLVVAADKGTATFSDIANALADEYNYWLGDAFASGGSVGYDHKAMGITARGAWESVKRHFRMLGMDIQNKDDFSVVGIGDMSGDVFGNGMLLSKHIKLQAAFNHLHIFIDPTPDPKASFDERQRLFNLTKSSWDDYDESLISTGGGVFSRADKSITISDEMKSVFDINKDTLTPNELINALLKAPLDLIWNGGIGTYIKSQHETHSDVGDRANDAVRVNGHQVRARVIGEGGNLGCTQLGRIEYARSGGTEGSGGHNYTDAIDNSGGVNCSDHEVNIKILLGKVVEEGDMTVKQRNKLLESMTDSVAELVLRQNYLQPQAIELSIAKASENLSDHSRFIEYLEEQQRLDRHIEFLPTVDELKERQKEDTGLTRPELAVILAYGKMWVYDELLNSDLPDEDYFEGELRKYFPNELVDKYFTQMVEHRLHREIISTYLTNSVVNHLGIEAIFRLFEETDQSVATIVRAFVIVTEVFNVKEAWHCLEALDNKVEADKQINLELRMREVFERGMVWFLNAFGAKLNVVDMIQRFSESVTELTKKGGFIEKHYEDLLQQDMQKMAVNDELLNDRYLFVMLPYHLDALDTTLLAKQYDKPLTEVASLYFETCHKLNYERVLEMIKTLPQQNYWDRRARHALINELNRVLRQLMNVLLSDETPKDALSQWQQTKQNSINTIEKELDNLENTQVSFSTMSVIMSQLSQLAEQEA